MPNQNDSFDSIYDDLSELYWGDRVNTPLGPGTVAYVRYAPPFYSTIQAVSVVLDNKRDIFGYSGTIFSIDKISKIE